LALLNDRERVNLTTKKTIRDADQNGFFDVVLNRKAPQGMNVVIVTLVAVAIYFIVVFWFVLLYTKMVVGEDKAD
jgi:phosphotransferase system  glucose/maltose/N-acetylglucosamine-specific IIC component